MIILRHGQSAFNLAFTETKRDPGIPDPPLTPLGEAQAEAAARGLETLGGITRLLVSPYTRALQTADALARRLGLPMEVTDAVREHCAFSCDIGTPASVLAGAWPQCDFSAIPEIWWPDANEDGDAVRARALTFRRRMAQAADQAGTVVVCHWGFTLALTGAALDNGDWIAFEP